MPRAESSSPIRFAGAGLACVRGGRALFAGLDFALAPGGLLLLAGPNGIGKSSLLRLMAGLAPPAQGTIHREGFERLAYLGHADALKAQLTVAETLAFWSLLQGAGGDAAREAVHDAVARFALAPLLALPCRHLSAGQRRRLALARVAASGAALWLLDEPATALDAAGTAAFAEALGIHRARGGMAVIAGHGGFPAEDAEVLEIARFAMGASA